MFWFHASEVQTTFHIKLVCFNTGTFDQNGLNFNKTHAFTDYCIVSKKYFTWNVHLIFQRPDKEFCHTCHHFKTFDSGYKTISWCISTFFQLLSRLQLLTVFSDRNWEANSNLLQTGSCSHVKTSLTQSYSIIETRHFISGEKMFLL